MNLRRSVFACALLFAAATSSALPADAPKPLRTLVYDISWDAVTTTERHDSGIGGSASGTTRAKVANPDTGTLTIDVLAATGDGGLVLDTTFAGKTLSQPAARIALAEDGTIITNPGTNLIAPVRRFVPLLARGIIKDRDFTAGASWTAPVPPPATGTITYKVRTVEGTFATFDMTYSSAISTVPRTDENGQASVSYDTFHVCPLKYDLQAKARRNVSVDVEESTDYHLIARLTSDSLSGVKPQ